MAKQASEIKPITHNQRGQLSKIHSSTKWVPCQVKLNNGNVYENIFLAEIDGYLRSWGGIPSDEMLVNIEDVNTINESPNRLPVDLAEKLYESGESGMGYVIFKIVYRDGATLDVLTGNAVDFVPSPDGLSISDIVDVLPHKGSREHFIRGLEYKWCLYKDIRSSLT